MDRTGVGVVSFGDRSTGEEGCSTRPSIKAHLASHAHIQVDRRRTSPVHQRPQGRHRLRRLDGRTPSGRDGRPSSPTGDPKCQGFRGCKPDFQGVQARHCQAVRFRLRASVILGLPKIEDNHGREALEVRTCRLNTPIRRSFPGRPPSARKHHPARGASGARAASEPPRHLGSSTTSRAGSTRAAIHPCSPQRAT